MTYNLVTKEPTLIMFTSQECFIKPAEPVYSVATKRQ